VQESYQSATAYGESKRADVAGVKAAAPIPGEGNPAEGFLPYTEAPLTKKY